MALGFLAGLRLDLSCSTSGAGVAFSIESLVMCFSLVAVAVVTLITPVPRNTQRNLRRLCHLKLNDQIGGLVILFYRATELGS